MITTSNGMTSELQQHNTYHLSPFSSFSLSLSLSVSLISLSLCLSLSSVSSLSSLCLSVSVSLSLSIYLGLFSSLFLLCFFLYASVSYPSLFLHVSISLCFCMSACLNLLSVCPPQSVDWGSSSPKVVPKKFLLYLFLCQFIYFFVLVCL